MWECVRCGNENQDSETKCTVCGREKNTDGSGLFREQGIEYLKKAAELLRKSDLDTADEETHRLLDVLDRYLALQKDSQKMERLSKTLFIVNEEEFRKRKEVRSYNGTSVEEICRRFLFYRENQNINNGQKCRDRLVEALQVPHEDKIYLLHDDTLLNTGKNGFAITDRGMYVRELMEKPQFMSWEDFRECTEIGRSGSSLKADKKSIIYMSGTESALQLEAMLIAVYWSLN